MPTSKTLLLLDRLRHSRANTRKMQPKVYHTLLGRAPSATLASREIANKLLAEGKQVFRFGLGQSPFPVMPRELQLLCDAQMQID